MTTHCHHLIAKTARGIAGAFYEIAMGENNAVYSEWKKMNSELSPKAMEQKFIDLFWGKFIDQARATLSSMLDGDHPEPLKQQILDALIRDNALRRGKPTSPLSSGTKLNWDA